MASSSGSHPKRNRQRLPDGIPHSVDWQKEGVMTGVKDQGERLCCWAFSTAGALEGQYKYNFGETVDLSVQELINCVKLNPSVVEPKYKTYPCSLVAAYEWVKKNGLLTEKLCPWTGYHQTCELKEQDWTGVNITGYIRVRSTEAELLKALAHGPISAGILYGQELKNLREGIWEGQGFLLQENGKYLYHAIILIGYETEADGRNVFLFKNSWGERWGKAGYGKVLRDSSRRDTAIPLIKNAIYCNGIMKI